MTGSSGDSSGDSVRGKDKGLDLGGDAIHDGLDAVQDGLNKAQVILPLTLFSCSLCASQVFFPHLSGFFRLSFNIPLRVCVL